jgi:hypothetical protein
MTDSQPSSTFDELWSQAIDQHVAALSGDDFRALVERTRPKPISATSTSSERTPPMTTPTTQTDATPVDAAQTAITRAANEFERHLANIQPGDYYTSEGMQKKIGEFTQSDAARNVDSAVAAVRDRADKAQARVEEIRRGLSPYGDTAAELRATRYWTSAARILDTAKDVNGAAQSLVADADRTQLGVLMRELPNYLKSRGLTGNWIDPVIEQKVPELHAARTQARQAQRARDVIEHNAAALQQQYGLANPAVYRRPIIVDVDKYDPDAGGGATGTPKRNPVDRSAKARAAAELDRARTRLGDKARRRG